MSTLLEGPATGEITRPITSRSPDDPRSPRRGSRVRRWLLLAAAATLVLFVGASIGLRLAHPGVLPGVELAGTQVGGMDRGEVRAFAEGLAGTTEAQPVTVAYADHLSSLLPSDVGYDLDAEATAEAAWAVGRTGNPLADTWSHLRALWATTEVPVVDSVDDAELTSWTDGVADAIDRNVGDGGISVDPETLEVTVDAPTEGYETDRESLRAAVRGALAAPLTRDLTAPVAVTPVRVDVESVREVAEDAGRVLEGDTTLRVEDVTSTLTPVQVAALLTLEVIDDEARLAVSAESIDETLTDLGEQLTVAPIDARFDLPAEPVEQVAAKGDVAWEPVPVDVRIVEGVPGRQFDVAIVAETMGSAFRDGSREVTIELPEVEPDTTASDLAALNVTELLGTFTTEYQPGQPRVVNIRRLADVLDGTVVAPGEQFSINRISGERTCAKGYARDGMIYNGELIKVCGGGVSQVGTAVFNAAFFAGVQIDQHKPHSWYISRYPKGREATLDFDTDIDVKFTNDTGNGLVVVTDHSSRHLTVSIYGTSDVAKVEARHGSPHNARQAPVQYVEDPTMEPGTERVVDAGHSGFDIDITRVITFEDGDTVDETWSHRYVTSPRIIHRNSEEPEPAPSPSGGEGQPDGGEGDGADEPKDEGPSDQQPSSEPSEGGGDGPLGG